MKYMKTFESFSINENSSDINNVMSLVDGEVSKLPEAELQKLLGETQAMADKLGVSLEELSNPEFAAKTMIDEAEKANLPIEENWAGDIWNWLKSRSATWYRALGRVLGWGGGITSLATMVSATVIGGAERNNLALYLRELTGIGELDRTTQAGIFLAGMAGIIISILAGIALSNKADDVERANKFGSKF